MPVWNAPAANAAASLPVNDTFEDPSLSATAVTASSGSVYIDSTNTDYRVQISSSLSSGWVYSASDNYAQIVDDPFNSGNKALLLFDNQGSSLKGSTRFSRLFTELTGNYKAVTELDFLFRDPHDVNPDAASTSSISTGNRIRLMNASGSAALLSLETASGNALVYRTGSSTTNNLATIQFNKWYHVKVNADYSSQTLSIDLTDKSTGASLASLSSVNFYQASTFGMVDANSGNSSTAALYLDNIQVYVPLSAPSNLSAAGGNGQVSLSWDSVTDATYYNVKRSNTSGGPYATVNAGPVTGTGYTDTTVTNGSTYYYVVTAANLTSESDYSAEVSATPVAAAGSSTPSGLTASGGSGQVSLYWNAVDGAVSYNVKRSTTQGGPYSTVGNVTETSFTDTDVTNGTKYYYVVTAVSGSGEESASSNETSATPFAYLVYSGFEDSTLPTDAVQNGGTLDGYSVKYTKTTSPIDSSKPNPYAQIVSQEAPSWAGNAGNKAMYVYDQDKNSGIKVVKTFETQTDKVIVGEIDFKQDTSVSSTLFSNTKAIRLLDSKASNIIADVEASSSTLAYRVGSVYTPLIPKAEYVPGKWYHIKVIVDLTYPAKGVIVSATDGEKTWELKDQTFYQTGTVNIGSVDFSTSDGNAGYVYYDNVKVYEMKAPPISFGETVAYAGNTRVNLTWDRVLGATSYSVKRSTTAGGPYETVASGIAADTSATKLSYLDEGLANGKSYYYVITANNAYGSIDSAELAAAPSADKAAPATPQNLKAEVRDSSLNISWDSTPDTLRYILKRSTSIDGTYTELSPDQDITGTSYLDTGLANETPYYYKISAFNAAGESVESAPLMAIPTKPLQPPTGLTAAPGHKKVTLTWNGVLGATSYNVKRSTANGGPYETIAANIETNSYTDTEVADGTTYYYVATAVNSKTESMISNQAKATPYEPVSGAPAVPNGLVAAADEGKITLNWNGASGASSYTVKRSTASGGSYVTVASGLTATSFTDSGVTNGMPYYYVVSASNENGESANSEEVIAVPAEVYTVDPAQATDASAKRFQTVSEAVAAIPAANAERKVIYIKKGVYHEKITVTAPYVSFVGEDRDETIIEYGDYAGPSGNGKLADGSQIYSENGAAISSTFDTPTVAVTGNYFTASNLTIENSAGPREIYGTAVALSVKSDQSVFDNVKLLGYQDTLYNGSGRQYFRNSVIRGDVDFIFGEATAIVFDNCDIVSAAHPNATSTSGGYVTAAAQTNESDYGYVFFNSRLIKDSTATGSHYLGRPWKNNPKVRFVNTAMDSHIVASGWKTWNVDPVYYGEYNSTGEGSNPAGRDVTLSRQMSAAEASGLTVPIIFAGWDPTKPAALPKKTPNPSLSESSLIYDMHNGSDLSIPVQFDHDALTSVKNGEQLLRQGEDYRTTSVGVVIRQAYLDGLTYGKHNLTVQFGSGASIPVALAVVDSSMIHSLDSGENGWASYAGVVSGGNNAAFDQIYFVKNRKELVDALGGASAKTNATPKIIYVQGKVDMNVDDNNQPLKFKDYSSGTYDGTPYDFDLDAYLANPTDPNNETNRYLAQKAQAARVKVNVGSNTTIVGLGSDAGIVGGNLAIENAGNVIIRNLHIGAAYDYFPQWDPTDGSTGNWNSQYDAITVKTSTRVWIDHNSFTDATADDLIEATYFGKHYQHYDGFVDITNQSDLVTISYNHFKKHDKTFLIGSSDSEGADKGKLRTTIHHNYFEDIVQRVPRVRYGQVHLYNNYYNSLAKRENSYSIGVGVSAQVYSEANYFEAVRVPVAYYDNAEAVGAIKDVGSYYVNSGVPITRGDVTWNPRNYYTYSPDSSETVKTIVLTNAGAGQPGQTLSVPASEAEIGLQAVSADNRVYLTWTTVTSATYYTVMRSTVSGGPYEVVQPNVPPASPDDDLASFTDNDAAQGNTYYYLVTAANSLGEFVKWNEAYVTVSAAAMTKPSAPTNLIAKAKDAKVNLAWDTVTGATYYTVKRGFASEGPFVIIKTELTETGYTDTSVANGKTYYYVVTAVNDAGESEASNIARALPREEREDREEKRSSGSGSGSTNASTGDSTAPNAETAVQKTSPSTATVTVNPVKEQTAAGDAILKGSVDAAALREAIDALRTAAETGTPRIEIVVEGSGSAAKVQLPLSAVAEAQSKLPEAIIPVKFDTFAYELPVKAIATQALSQRLGAKPQEVTISATIAKVTGTVAAALAEALKQNGLTPVTDAVDFTVTAEANGQSETLNDFGVTYVSITFTVGKALDPKTATAILYDPVSGNISFVPAIVSVTGGTSQVVLKRPGNSIYVVVETVQGSFADLNGHWAKQDVELLASKLVVQGVTETNFAPDQAVTRAEFAALLVRGLGLSEVETASYADVKNSDWYAGTVGAAVKAGLVDGFEDGTFRPDAQITREQMAVMAARALQIAGKKADSGANQTPIPFADGQSVDNWAKDAVAQAVNAGIINGKSDGMFLPLEKASRAEAAVMLKRLLQAAELINP